MKLLVMRVWARLKMLELQKFLKAYLTLIMLRKLSILSMILLWILFLPLLAGCAPNDKVVVDTYCVRTFYIMASKDDTAATKRQILKHDTLRKEKRCDRR